MDPRLTVDVDGVEVGLHRRLDLIAGTNVTLVGVANPTDDTVEVTVNSTGGGGGVVDGDKGDIVVSGSGVVWTIDATGPQDNSTFLRGDRVWAHVEATRFAVKNTSGVTLPIGSPIYATGSVGASGATEVAMANASNSATMPAIGVLEEQLLNNGEGFAVPLGVVRQLDTSAYASNGTVFVAAGGGLTPTRPSGATDLVQNLGRVTRVHATTGEILVMGPGRSNDVPNKIAIANLPTGTTASDVAIGNDARLSDDRTASGLRTATTVVATSGASAPSAGQVLTATSGTAAAWSSPAGGDDTIYADAEVAARNVASTTNVDLCVRTITVAVGDTIVLEAFGTLLNNSPATRTYTVQATISAPANPGTPVMTCSVADGGSVAASATNRSPHFFRAVISVASTSSAAIMVESSRAVSGASNTGLSTAGTQIRQGWQSNGSNFVGANVSVGLALRSNSATATQTFYVHSWNITRIPRRL